MPQLVCGILRRIERGGATIFLDRILNGFWADPFLALAQEKRLCTAGLFVFRPYGQIPFDRVPARFVQVNGSLLGAFPKNGYGIFPNIADVDADQLGKTHPAI